MDWKKQPLHILGLTPKEKNLLNLLRSSLSLQELAHKSPIPRTSIAYSLKKILRAGFIKKIPAGKRFKYYSISSTELGDLLHEAHRELYTKGSLPSFNTQARKELCVFQNTENILLLLERVIALYEGQRIYAIQSNVSWQAMHKYAGFAGVIRLNKAIYQHKIIIEGIIERDAYELFRKIHKGKAQYDEFVQSFTGRMADYSFAPVGFLTQEIETWIINDVVIFLNWKKEFAIQVVNKDLSLFLIDMFQIAKEAGKKIDHNLSMRELLK